jgi:hypothetical protein
LLNEKYRARKSSVFCISDWQVKNQLEAGSLLEDLAAVGGSGTGNQIGRGAHGNDPDRIGDVLNLEREKLSGLASNTRFLIQAGKKKGGGGKASVLRANAFKKKGKKKTITKKLGGPSDLPARAGSRWQWRHSRSRGSSHSLP